MPSLLTKYVARTTLLAILLVSIVLLGVDGLLAMVRELKSIGKGDYTLWVALQHVGLTLPRRFYNMFPMAALLGSLLGLGLLAQHNELTVMRAAGVSIQRLIMMVMSAGLLLTAVVTLLGEFVVPKAEYLADTIKIVAKNHGQAYYIGSGAWLKDGNSFIYVREVLPDGGLRHVLRYQFDQQQALQEASVAEQATYTNAAWQLRDVTVSHIDPITKQVSTEYQAQATWPLNVSAEMLAVLVKSPEDSSLRELRQSLHYLNSNQLATEKYDLALWQKLLQPLTILIMIFLAVPFVCGPLRQVTMGARLVVGIFVGFSFYILNQLFGPMALSLGIAPVIGAALPGLVFAFIAMLLVKKTN